MTPPPEPPVDGVLLGAGGRTVVVGEGGETREVVDGVTSWWTVGRCNGGMVATAGAAAIAEINRTPSKTPR